jgi:hypothetical protein
MRFAAPLALLVSILAACVIPLAAHHSVPETFDISKETTIQGLVTRIEWRNPHARYWVDARNGDGAVESWEMELAPPNALRRTLGVEFINAGDRVTVAVWRAKDGSRLATVLTLTVPDGRVFNFSRDTRNPWRTISTAK